MNKLVASWHRPGSDVVDHLLQAHGQLLGLPDQESVLALVDAALLEQSLAGHPVEAPHPEKEPASEPRGVG